MPRRKGSGPFWQAWTQAQRSGAEDTAADTDARAAWRQHFSAFLGVAPEKHWLFGGRRFKPWISGRWGRPALFNPFVATILSKGGGLLSLFVLHLLAEKPRYGNDIMREIEERTRGRWASNPGAVYPLLDAMERRELVEGEWEDPEKRTRRIYRLMPAGERELERLKEVMRPKLEEAIRIMRHLHDDLEIEVEG